MITTVQTSPFSLWKSGETLKDMKCYKRYEYWASENGKPIKKWTDFFLWDSDIRDEWQLKGKLRNFYKDE